MPEEDRSRVVVPDGKAVRVDVPPFFKDLVVTSDFKPDDPWSVRFRNVLIARAARFSGRPLLEFGIGGAPNPLEIVHVLNARGVSGPSSIHGVELDDWRGDIASHNLDVHGLGVDYEVDIAHAVTWLEGRPAGEVLRGNALFCLPQAPISGAENNADGYS